MFTKHRTYITNVLIKHSRTIPNNTEQTEAQFHKSTHCIIKSDTKKNTELIFTVYLLNLYCIRYQILDLEWNFVCAEFASDDKDPTLLLMRQQLYNPTMMRPKILMLFTNIFVILLGSCIYTISVDVPVPTLPPAQQQHFEWNDKYNGRAWIDNSAVESLINENRTLSHNVGTSLFTKTASIPNSCSYICCE